MGAAKHQFHFSFTISDITASVLSLKKGERGQDQLHGVGVKLSEFFPLLLGLRSHDVHWYLSFVMEPSISIIPQEPRVPHKAFNGFSPSLVSKSQHVHQKIWVLEGLKLLS
ncbi:hypothetical protein TorRG33x02_315540 [Trema orientale]|uniref:Uncharacterized protein n=1 Tax=Trema orientale TaxID=63057 RepID=A0A2P5BMW0_TREOI|nr:hypothetical protein TorRG33x02_315540 [Trema orientale]